MTINQAITRRVHTSTLTFLGKPSEETCRALIETGYQFDRKSKQWYRRDETADVTSEEVIAKQLAA